MKKTLFIALAVAGFSQFSFAQEASMTPAPAQAELDRDAQAKAASKQEVATKQEAAAKSTKANKQADAEYKKIGLNDNQIAAVNKANSHYDAKKAAINNNSKLTAEEKKNQVDAVEAERKASLQKRMGEDKYKKYTELDTAPADAPSKKAAKPTSKPAN